MKKMNPHYGYSLLPTEVKNGDSNNDLDVSLPQNHTLNSSKMRTFSSGATRNQDTDKLDFEGFLSPLVIERYATYMHTHRKQADGSMRDSDNWQLGVPISSYIKSLWRHFFAVWKGHRTSQQINQDDLCGVIFNAMGLMHELLKSAHQEGNDKHESDSHEPTGKV